MYCFSIEQPADLTVGIKKMILPYAFGNVFFDGDNVTGFEEKKDIITYALAGIYVMKPAVLSKIPSDSYFGMDSLIQSMLSVNEAICKYEIHDYWLDIGNIHDFEKAQKEFKEISQQGEV